MVIRILLTLAISAGGLAGAMAGPAADELPGFLRKWLAAQKNAPDIRVDFTLTKTMPTLKEPVKSVGRLWNYSDGRFRWETGKPPTCALVYDGVTLQCWQSDDNQWQKLNPNNHGMRLWLDFLGGQKLTAEVLTRDFKISAPATTGKSTASVVLEPKSKRDRKDLKHIELKFNTGEPRLIQLHVVQGDDGSQTMDFSEPKKMSAADRAVVPMAKPE